MVITRVASALVRDSDAAPVGRLVVIGNETSEVELSDFWAQATGSKGDFRDAVDYVAATDDSWKTVVHREIARCGCVILFLSPKDESFPRFEMPDANVLLTPGGYDTFYHLPMKENATGKGLLQEVAYLERMERVDHTILLSHESHRQEILKTIEHSYFAMYGDVTIFGMGGMRAVHPRKTALEKNSVCFTTCLTLFHSTTPNLNENSKNHHLQDCHQSLKRLSRCKTGVGDLKPWIAICPLALRRNHDDYRQTGKKRLFRDGQWRTWCSFHLETSPSSLAKGSVRN
jgi:hypothetical protein